MVTAKKSAKKKTATKAAVKTPVKASARGRGRPSRGFSEVLYLRVTPEYIERLQQHCEKHHISTGICASLPEMARKLLMDALEE